MTNPDEGVTFLVNRQIRRHTGPFTTRMDALLAMNIAANPGQWEAMARGDFDLYLKESRP